MLTAVPDPTDDGSSVLEDPGPDWTVTGPAVWHDMPEHIYHGDPVVGGSLSSTGVRNLLPPHCPAHFRYWADNPQPPRPEFDRGHAVHSLLFGVGATVVPVEPHLDGKGRPSEAWNTTAVKAEVEGIRAAGMVPVKRSEYDAIVAMVAAVRAHPQAGAAFDPDYPGLSEVAVFWDSGRGFMRRALLDRVRPGTADRRPLVVDYKHTSKAGGASPAKMARTVWEFGYHVQGVYYEDAVSSTPELQGESELEPHHVLVVQESDPPYLVGVYQPDAGARRWARRQIRAASRVFAECTASGLWPGYTDDRVAPLALPTFAEYELEAQIAAGFLDGGQ